MRTFPGFITLLVLQGVVCDGLFAQTLQPRTMASAGQPAAGTGYAAGWTCGEVVTGTLTTGKARLCQGFQQSFLPYSVWGDLTYDNAWNTPMAGSVARLEELSGTDADSSLVRSGGAYYFFHTAPGTYITNADVYSVWGGVNAIDALLILKHFAGLSALEGLALKAADTDASGGVNSIDALLAARRYTGMIGSFPAGDFIVSRDTLVYTSGKINQPIKVRCVGDVNASYLPP